MKNQTFENSGQGCVSKNRVFFTTLASILYIKESWVEPVLWNPRNYTIMAVKEHELIVVGVITKVMEPVIRLYIVLYLDITQL